MFVPMVQEFKSFIITYKVVIPIINIITNNYEVFNKLIPFGAIIVIKSSLYKNFIDIKSLIGAFYSIIYYWCLSCIGAFKILVLHTKIIMYIKNAVFPNKKTGNMLCEVVCGVNFYAIRQKFYFSSIKYAE